MEIGVILITKDKEKWNTIFNDQLIFSTLTDEHILRILFLQKIKISQNIDDIVKIYMEDYNLDDFTISDKLYKILKYNSGDYNIRILDINDGYDIDEIVKYNNKIVTFKDKTL
tara:strand:+ start:1256 stop:1594 length:339 start_codon:yes stop_codon:yes gene_type:complete